jgi:hypothetical protein
VVKPDLIAAKLAQLQDRLSRIEAHHPSSPQHLEEDLQAFATEVAKWVAASGQP